MPVLRGLGKALRWLRAKQDRHQYEVAAAAGITKAMLSAYETGKQKPSLETLEKILEALGADLADLHDALLIVNDLGALPARARSARTPDGQTAVGERRRFRGAKVDVYSVLGLDHRLPAEEERAFGEMLSGFHRLIRYMHASLEATAGGSGEAGGGGSRKRPADKTDGPGDG